MSKMVQILFAVIVSSTLLSASEARCSETKGELPFSADVENPDLMVPFTCDEEEGLTTLSSIQNLIANREKIAQERIDAVKKLITEQKENPSQLTREERRSFVDPDLALSNLQLGQFDVYHDFMKKEFFSSREDNEDTRKEFKTVYLTTFVLPVWQKIRANVSRDLRKKLKYLKSKKI
jgi:hypothetical protein